MLSARNGWGFKTGLLGVSSTIAGVNVVTRNVGVGVVVNASGPIRLTKLLWRVDLAPDVAPGSVASPVRFRLIVVPLTEVPQDVGIWQAQDFNGAGIAQPGIASTSPKEPLYDSWLDFSNGDPGLNQLATQEFADAGPRVDGGSGLLAMLVPIIDAQMSQAVVPPNGTIANAQLTIAAYGLGDLGTVSGGSSIRSTGASLPRYDGQ